MTHSCSLAKVKMVSRCIEDRCLGMSMASIVSTPPLIKDSAAFSIPAKELRSLIPIRINSSDATKISPPSIDCSAGSCIMELQTGSNKGW